MLLAQWDNAKHLEEAALVAVTEVQKPVAEELNRDSLALLPEVAVHTFHNKDYILDHTRDEVLDDEIQRQEVERKDSAVDNDRADEVDDRDDDDIPPHHGRHFDRQLP